MLFEQAFAAAPLTLPAHSTIFTGLLPPKHGVRDNGGYVLDGRHTTLAGVLKDGGWQTGAFVGAFVLDSKWGLEPRVRHVRRQVRRVEVQVDLARRRGAPRGRGRRQRDALAGPARVAALLRLAALLRRALAVRSSGTLQVAVCRSPLCRGDCLRGRPDRPRPAVARRPRPDGPHDRGRDRRSRREPQRARRRHARALHLRCDDAHPLHRAGAVHGDTGAPRAGRRPQRGRDADDPRSGRPAVTEGGAGPQSRPAADRRDAGLESRCVQRVAVRAEPLRVERAEVDPIGPVQVHLGDAARAVRSRARSRGAEQPLRRAPSARRPDGGGARAAVRSRSRAGRSLGRGSGNPRAARRARLHRIVRPCAAAGRGSPAGSQGQDRHLQPDDVGARDQRQGCGSGSASRG